MKISGLTWILLLLLLVACASGSGSERDQARSPEAEQVPAAETANPTASIPTSSPTADQYAVQRQNMVESGVVDWGITEEAVIEVMGQVPRHEFVPEEYLSSAYNNHPLPIGFGQTISQPYIVALMTQSAALSEDDQVLEIGTGSGYQAAVLAELVDHVYTIEIIEPLAERAEMVLDRLGYNNVTVRQGSYRLGRSAGFRHCGWSPVLVKMKWRRAIWATFVSCRSPARKGRRRLPPQP